ncbi:alpha-amylase/4-alpha-glucanotransferase domain-containing protein [bacterium]
MHLSLGQTMKPVYLAIGIHNHQPVGNFDFVLEEAYQKSYLPFFELLEKHPDIRLAMHYSGILLEWIEKHHPDYIKRLKTQVQAGQIEMMTGGYYEPILSVIPEQDRQGQIEKLSKYIHRKTGDDPQGLWCAERIWEPQLAGPLARAGVRYTILDDTHFKCAGLRDEELYGYFLTEELGERLRLFPISAKLRYMIPFQDPQATIEYCKQVAQTDENLLLVFADDGEKFGNWPGTYDHVFKNHWLGSFFQALEENSDWLHLIHFRDALTQLPPHGRVYLPTASYMEMMQWTLPAKGFQEYEDFENRLKSDGLWDQYGIYVRGGIWRSFLAKYHESNQMHKKMIRVSKKLAETTLTKKDQTAAQDHLWAGQCNCPYWHGVFGGLYLPHLRHANYGELIRAERIIDQTIHGNGNWVNAEVTDFDTDGHDEVLLENNYLNLYFSPLGGRMIELDDRVAAHNYLNILNRREEGYHRKLREMNQSNHASDHVASIHDIMTSKEEGLDQYLIVDPYRRGSWIDHFLGDEATLKGFSKGEYPETGDFIHAHYEKNLKKQKSYVTLTWSRQGVVHSGSDSYPVQIEKSFILNSGASQVKSIYKISNLSDISLSLKFGIEHGFAFHAGNDPKRFYCFNEQPSNKPLLNSLIEEREVEDVSLTDTYMNISIALHCDIPGTAWCFPLETVSMSESGFERVYQGSVILLHWRLNLSPGETRKMELVEQIENSA